MSEKKRGVRCTLGLHDYDEKRVKLKPNRLGITLVANCLRCGKEFDKWKIDNVCECGDIAELHQEIRCGRCDASNTVCHGCKECDHFAHRYHVRGGK